MGQINWDLTYGELTTMFLCYQRDAWNKLGTTHYYMCMLKGVKNIDVGTFNPYEPKPPKKERRDSLYAFMKARANQK